MSQYPNDQWGQQPAQWQNPAPGAQQVAATPASPTGRNDLIKSLVVGLGLIGFTIAMFLLADRLFYVLPIFGVVIIIQGVVKFLKARKSSAQHQTLAAWNGQQQAMYPPQQVPPDQGYPQQPYNPQQASSASSAQQYYPQPGQQHPQASAPQWQPQNQQNQNQQPQNQQNQQWN